MSLPEFVHTLLNNNQFAAGGIATVLVGSVIAFMKDVPHKIWSFLISQTTVFIIITDKTEGFFWFKQWFAKQERANTLRKNDLNTYWKDDQTLFNFVPAPGVHWMWNHGYPLAVEFIRKENNGGNGDNEGKRTEDFKITAFGRNPARLRSLVDKMKEAAVEKDKGQLIVRTVTGTGEVFRYENFLARGLDSVVLPEGVKDDIVEDITKFLHSRSWYEATGIPYHRGYLLHGLPGTGKTSLSVALANHFNLPVYIINLNSLSDEGLLNGLRNRGCPVMFVLEDIDCAVNKRREIAGNQTPDEDMVVPDKIFGVTLSGLLNAMDGILAPTGALFFMTTNVIEKLDPALLRPGRCDVKIEFKEITKEQKEEMTKRFFPGITDIDLGNIVGNNNSSTPAEFQDILLKLRGTEQVITDSSFVKKKSTAGPSTRKVNGCWITEK